MNEREPGIQMAQVLELLSQGKSGTEIAIAVFTERKLELVPVGDEDWTLFSEFLLIRTELVRSEKMNGNGEALNAFDRKNEALLTAFDSKLDQIPQERLDRLQPYFERLRDATSIPLKRRFYSPDSLGLSSEMSPGERPGVEELRVRDSR